MLHVIHGKTAISRQQLGLAIANITGALKRINELKYVVKSSGNDYYDISSTDLGWVCSCPDHKFRGVKCKHIFAVEISFAYTRRSKSRVFNRSTSIVAYSVLPLIL
ncbi:MAG: SWIM zinc finger family protein [Candidatus Nitrosopolaris sp.]